MRKLFLSLALLSCLLVITPAGSEERQARGMYPRPSLEEDKYYTCKEDKHCTTANLPCGRVVILNTLYQKEVQGWSDFVGPRFQCLATVSRQQASNISCVKGVCRGDITQMSPVMEDTPENRNPSYCKTIDDCAVVLGPCYKKIIINKKFKDQLQREYDHVRDMNMERCLLPDNRTVERLHCVQNTCSADLKIPDQSNWNEPVDIRNLPRHE